MLQAVRAEQPAPQKSTTQSRPRRRVDFMADDVLPYNKGGDSVVYFLGNFAAHHNGAVIACDSAVRYNDTRWGFFGDVIINQDSIYIYGDSAIYNGDISLAEIYAPVVKVIDGDALLYTYNFRFNTDTKVGSYIGGGVLVHDNDILESLKGFYYSEEHNIICVDDVEIHGSDYDMKSDSVIYNTDTKFARFFANSEIWNIDGEYLSADEGYYDNSQNLYVVTKNGYILTEKQEMWGDTLSYYRDTEHIIARSDIQMDDIEHKMLAFGDYGEFWGDKNNALLTLNPSSISYDTTQGDTVFMKADTMLFLTISKLEEAREARRKEIADSLAKIEQAAAEREALMERRKKFMAEKAEQEARVRAQQDSLEAIERANKEKAQQQTVTTSQQTIVTQQTDQKQEVVAEREVTTEQNIVAEQKSVATQETASNKEVTAQQVTTSQQEIEKQQEVDAQREAISQQAVEKQQEVTSQQEETVQQEAVQIESNDDAVTEKRKSKKSKKDNKAEKESPADTSADNNSTNSADTLDAPLDASAEALVADSLATDSLSAASALDTLTAKQLKEYLKQEAQREKDEQRKAKMLVRKQKLDSIAAIRRAKMIAQYEKMQSREMARLAKDSVRRAEKRAKLLAKGRDVSALDAEDSLAMVEKEKILADSLPAYLMRPQGGAASADSTTMDSLTEGENMEPAGTQADSLAIDSLAIDSLAADSTKADTLYRVMKAYRKVRIYRSDSQAICDLLTSSSIDSIVHMYIEPVMWNNNNQIAAAQVDAYTSNQQLLRAEFLENPIMVAEIDSSYYNQVTGKQMTAYFRNNEIYRNDVEGNVQTIYFQREDEESAIVTELVYLESASASFYIENKEVVGITYRNDVPFKFYPIALIPENQIQRLPNFKWVPELRPTRENIFDRTIRPSKREQSGERRRPTFRIVEKMDRYKERMMRHGLWIDREDELTPEVIEWRDSRDRN